MSSVLGSTAEWLRRDTTRSTTRERPSRRDLFTDRLLAGVRGVRRRDQRAVEDRRRGGEEARLAHPARVLQHRHRLADAARRRGGQCAGLRRPALRRLGRARWSATWASSLPGAVAVGALSAAYVRFGDRPLRGPASSPAATPRWWASSAPSPSRWCAPGWACSGRWRVAAGALLLSARWGAPRPPRWCCSASRSGWRWTWAPAAPCRVPSGLVGPRRRWHCPRTGASSIGPPGPEASTAPPTPPSAPRSARRRCRHACWFSPLVHAGGLDARLVEMAVVYFRTGLGAYGGGFAIIPHLKAMVRARTAGPPTASSPTRWPSGSSPRGRCCCMATFLGYLEHGLAGAAVATVAIFAAPFLLVVLLGTWLDRMRSRRWVRAALRGLTPAVVGLMAGSGHHPGQRLSTTKAEVGIAAATALTAVALHREPGVDAGARRRGPAGPVVRRPLGPAAARGGQRRRPRLRSAGARPARLQRLLQRRASASWA